MRFEKATAMQRFVECHFIVLDRNTVIFVEPPDLALPYFLVKIYHRNHTFAVFTKKFKIRHQRADDINESVRMREGNPCNYKLSLQDIFHVNSPSNNIATYKGGQKKYRYKYKLNLEVEPVQKQFSPSRRKKMNILGKL